jgi:hypothetical protein
MSEIYWPETLPLPHLDFAGSSRNATLQSPEEFQARIYRRQQRTATYLPCRLVWNFDAWEFHTFEQFAGEVLYNCAHPFNIQLRYPKNSVLSGWVVRFISGYETDVIDRMWTVTAEIVLMRPIYIAAEAPLLSSWIGFIEAEGLPFHVIGDRPLTVKP